MIISDEFLSFPFPCSILVIDRIIVQIPIRASLVEEDYVFLKSYTTVLYYIAPLGLVYVPLIVPLN